MRKSSITSEIDTGSDTINTPHRGSQLGSVTDHPSSRAASSDAGALSYGYGGFVPDDSSEGLVDMHDVKHESASRYKVCHIRSSSLFYSTRRILFR
jgi:hypothetical protein